MKKKISIIIVFKIISIVIPVLVSVYFFTIAERKIMGSGQWRKRPNVIGFIGLLKPFSDGLKLFALLVLLVCNGLEAYSLYIYDFLIYICNFPSNLSPEVIDIIESYLAKKRDPLLELCPHHRGTANSSDTGDVPVEPATKPAENPETTVKSSSNARLYALATSAAGAIGVWLLKRVGNKIKFYFNSVVLIFKRVLHFVPYLLAFNTVRNTITHFGLNGPNSEVVLGVLANGVMCVGASLAALTMIDLFDLFLKYDHSEWYNFDLELRNILNYNPEVRNMEVTPKNVSIDEPIEPDVQEKATPAKRSNKDAFVAAGAFIGGVAAALVICWVWG